VLPWSGALLKEGGTPSSDWTGPPCLDCSGDSGLPRDSFSERALALGGALSSRVGPMGCLTGMGAPSARWVRGGAPSRGWPISRRPDSTERSQKAQSRTRTHDPSLPKPVLLTTELSELLNASLHRFYWSGLIWHRGSAEPHSSGGMAESSSASSPSMSGTSASSESPSRHPSEGSAIHGTAWPDGWPDCDGVGHAVEGSSKTESTQAQLISSARPLGIELWFLGAGAIYRE